jgi:hypothetical protein
MLERLPRSRYETWIVFEVHYLRGFETTLFVIPGSQEFRLMIVSACFGYAMISQPPSIYHVCGYGKPLSIPINKFSAYSWSSIGETIGLVFLYVALNSRQPVVQVLRK